MKSPATKITPPIISACGSPGVYRVCVKSFSGRLAKCVMMATARSLQSLLQSTKPEMLDKCLSTAAQTLGYTNLKPEQHRAAAEVLHGRDTFVSLPTGYGKSLVYQVLPACTREILLCSPEQVRDDAFRPVVFVISPLVSLMQDQAERLSDINVLCTFLSSEVVEGQIERVLAGDISVVFASPEALLQQRDGRKLILSAYVQRNIIAVAVDEAHCIVKW